MNKGMFAPVIVAGLVILAGCGSSGATAAQVHNCEFSAGQTLISYGSEFSSDVGNGLTGLEAMPKLLSTEQHTWSHLSSVSGCKALDSQQIVEVKHKLSNGYNILTSRESQYIGQLP